VKGENNAEAEIGKKRPGSFGNWAGLAEAQMKNVKSVLKAKVGKKEADNVYEILGKVLCNREKDSMLKQQLLIDMSTLK